MTDTAVFHKLMEHDTRFDAHDARFDAHDARFDAHDARFDAHDARFDAHDARFDAHDARFDAIEDKLAQHDGSLQAIAEKLLEHDDRFDRAEEESRKWRQEFLLNQDVMMKILLRLDQERIFTSEWMRRADLRFDQHDEAIAELRQRRE